MSFIQVDQAKMRAMLSILSERNPDGA